MEGNTPDSTEEQVALLDSQTWSLEMTISGAATFAVSFLPGWIEYGLEYYLDNLAPSNNNFSLVFPVLAYAFFKVTAWLLIFTFVAHLCLRALWVAAVGLHSAYPQGIQYDKIPNISEQYREVARTYYGSLSGFIRRLDLRCNRIYAQAFMMAMSLCAIGLIYLLLFVGILVLNRFIGMEWIEKIGLVAYVLFLVTMLLVLSVKSLSKKSRHAERYNLAAARFQLQMGRSMMLFFSDPLQYLSLTFMSNTTARRYYGTVAFIALFMMVAGMGVMFRKMAELRNRTIGLRTFDSQGSPANRLLLAQYDNLRPDGAGPANVSIPSDVIDGRMLPVFVKYAYYLDARLKNTCGTPTDDERAAQLPKAVARQYRDSVHLACFRQFYRVTLNDTVPLEAEWLYTEKNGLRGLVAYFDTKSFPPGRNRLLVQVPTESRPDSLEVFGVVPFWYAPK
ncbi:MAG: hypothetical protein SFV52_09645 [Saprospiraceae bacterium]|nr:hypothetical protein [Saprospiraceae bacterium]